MFMEKSPQVKRPSKTRTAVAGLMLSGAGVGLAVGWHDIHSAQSDQARVTFSINAPGQGADTVHAVVDDKKSGVGITDLATRTAEAEGIKHPTKEMIDTLATGIENENGLNAASGLYPGEPLSYSTAEPITTPEALTSDPAIKVTVTPTSTNN
jgi:hypothetical protein